MPRFYVYIWFIKETHKVFYVGKGSGNRVISMKDRNPYFRNIRKNYDCDYEIVKYFDSEIEAYEYEKQLGLEYKAKGEAWCCFILGQTDKFIDKKTRKKISTSLKGKPVWNKGRKVSEEIKQKQRAAKLGVKQSEETKQRRSAALLGHAVSKETRKKISDSKKGDKNPMFGKKQSLETIQKRRVSMIGHKVSMETREKIGKSNGHKVIKIDPKTNEILNTYNSASDAARLNGLNHSKISRVCNGYRKTTGGFRWEYLDKVTPS